MPPSQTVKAVIPAAGFGTRFLPLAKAVPKELLPLGDRPVIHYVVAEAVAAGFDEILIVLGRGKEAIASYFTPNLDLERHLASVGRDRELEAVRAISDLGRVHYTYQAAMRGLGDALWHARAFVGGDPYFAVLLGDTVIHGESPLPRMAEAARSHHLPSVAIEPCAADKVGRYGIAGGRQIASGLFALEQLREKPAPQDCPRLTDHGGAVLPPHAFAARYLLSPEIFSLLEKTVPGYGGEIQLTDAMERLRAQRGLLGVACPGRRLDIGHPAGLFAAAKILGLLPP